MILTYEDGKIAVIKNSRRAVYGYDQRVELLGSDRAAAGAGEHAGKHGGQIHQRRCHRGEANYFFLERYMPAYMAEWASFVEAVLNKTAMPVTLDDGVAALAMAEAASRSAAEHKPVTLADV